MTSRSTPDVLRAANRYQGKFLKAPLLHQNHHRSPKLTRFGTCHPRHNLAKCLNVKGPLRKRWPFLFTSPYLQNRHPLPRLLAGPVDEGLRLGVLAIGQGGDVVTLGAAHRHVREGGHQLAPCQPLAHQVLASHGHPGVVHGGDDGEI